MRGLLQAEPASRVPLPEGILLILDPVGGVADEKPPEKSQVIVLRGLIKNFLFDLFPFVKRIGHQGAIQLGDHDTGALTVFNGLLETRRNDNASFCVDIVI